MLKFVIIVLVGYCLYRMFINDRKKNTTLDEKEKEHLIATGELVKDPVCGTYIDAESGITVRDGETVYRFCSYECRDEFLKKRGKTAESKPDVE